MLATTTMCYSGHTLITGNQHYRWVCEQFLNGTSAQYRLCSAIY